MTLGVGLIPTAVIFTVVVLNVTGTLYTDILVVPLVVSTAVFTAVLTVVFGMWFVRERTLSIHSIITVPRELFYWLAILVTFAVGTAVGDWTLEFTGWYPGRDRSQIVLVRLTSTTPVTSGMKTAPGVSSGSRFT